MEGGRLRSSCERAGTRSERRVSTTHVENAWCSGQVDGVVHVVAGWESFLTSRGDRVVRLETSTHDDEDEGMLVELVGMVVDVKETREKRFSRPA